MAKRSIFRRIAMLAAVALVVMVGLAVAFTSYVTPTRRDDIGKPIFTIGDQNYAKAISDGKNIVKFGPLPMGVYPGGVAFENHDDALQHLHGVGKEDAGWGVYRLSGDFGLDTYRTEGQAYINKSLLVVARSTESDRLNR